MKTREQMMLQSVLDARQGELAHVVFDLLSDFTTGRGREEIAAEFLRFCNRIKHDPLQRARFFKRISTSFFDDLIADMTGLTGSNRKIQ